MAARARGPSGSADCCRSPSPCRVTAVCGSSVTHREKSPASGGNAPKGSQHRAASSACSRIANSRSAATRRCSMPTDRSCNSWPGTNASYSSLPPMFSRRAWQANLCDGKRFPKPPFHRPSRATPHIAGGHGDLGAEGSTAAHSRPGLRHRWSAYGCRIGVSARHMCGGLIFRRTMSNRRGRLPPQRLAPPDCTSTRPTTLH